MAREMKDSGVEWIGDIPNGWNITRNKFVMVKEKQICPIYKNQDVLSLTQKGVIVRDLDNPTGKMPTSFDGYQYIHKGNLLMCLFDIDVTPRCIGLIKDDGITSPAYSQFIVNHGFANYYYYYYLMLDFSKELLHLAKNLRYSLTEELLGFVPVPFPPLEEQKNISNFLDKKCSEIDNLTADIEKQISLLEDYKKSIITEAVTKGLNPNVEMKDSGIEWIGKLPKHWKISKLKYLIQVNNTKSSNNEYKYVGLENVIGWAGKLVDDTNMSESEFVPESSSNKAKKGDVLFGKLRPYLGKVFISEENIICSTEFLIMRPVDIEGKYLKLLFLSRDLVNVIDRSTYGTKMPRANSSFILNQYIPIPNTQEQNEISAFLDKKCSEIDSLISDKKEQLEKLTSYKQSMIYEYVTGKKEVPTQEIA